MIDIRSMKDRPKILIFILIGFILGGFLTYYLMGGFGNKRENRVQPTKKLSFPVKDCSLEEKQKYMLTDEDIVTVTGELKPYKRHPNDPTDVALPDYILVLDKPLVGKTEMPIKELDIVTDKCGYTKDDIKGLVGKNVWLKGYLVTTYSEGHGIIVINAKIK